MDPKWSLLVAASGVGKYVTVNFILFTIHPKMFRVIELKVIK